MKAVYSGLIADYDTWELAETFFNSSTRRIFTTVGVERAEMVKCPFFRGMGAYLAGRLFSASRLIPFVIALIYGTDGIDDDAELPHEDAATVLFSFARSYFHVEVVRSKTWPTAVFSLGICC